MTVHQMRESSKNLHVVVRPSTRLFSTVVHRFAQVFCEKSIDAGNEKPYLARQIEPEAKT